MRAFSAKTFSLSVDDCGVRARDGVARNILVIPRRRRRVDRDEVSADGRAGGGRRSCEN